MAASLCFDVTFTEPGKHRKTVKIWGDSENDAKANFLALWPAAAIVSMRQTARRTFA